jgi:hypothetical protein
MKDKDKKNFDDKGEYKMLTFFVFSGDIIICCLSVGQSKIEITLQTYG